MRNLNGSFPKEWHTKSTNISKIYSWVRLKRSNFNAESSARKYDTVKKLDDFIKDLLKEKRKLMSKI